MTTLREAAQQALEALLTYEQYIQPLTNYFGGPRVPEEGSASAKVDAAITALRTALTQEQAEPKGGGNLPPPLQEPAVAENATTQQQLEDTPPSDYRRGYWDGFNIGKREGRIEAEDAAQQAEPVQEPVGYLPAYELNRLQLGHDGRLRSAKFGPSALDGDVAVYTTPPQRPPLTDAEIAEVYLEWDAAPGRSMADFARAIERARGIGEEK